MRASEYLIDIQAHNGTEVVTLRVATCGYTTGPMDTPPNTVYENVVSDPGDFSASFFGQGATIGDPEVGYGQIVLINTEGTLDDWINYAFDGRAFTVRRIASARAPYSSAQIVLSGTIENIDATSVMSELRLRIYDQRRVLDKPLQENRYGGTTLSGGPTADGTEDLKDQIKPLIFGRVLNVPATPVNPFDLIYQVTDSAFDSIIVYDGGVPIEPQNDYTTIAALQAATTLPGKCATAKNLGLFKLGWSPQFDITADVIVGAIAADRYPGAIARKLIQKVGITTDKIVESTFNTLDAAAPYECGIYIDDEMDALEAINKIMSSVGGSVVPDEQGRFIANRIQAPGVPVKILDEYEIQSDLGGSFGFTTNPDTDGGVPAWRIVLSHRKVWETQDSSRLAGCVTDDYRTYVAKEYREIKAEDATVKVKHLLSPELKIETLLTSESDATAEANRRLGLYKLNRRVLTVEVPYEEAVDIKLGTTVTIKAPVGIFKLGYDAFVIGRQDRLKDDTVAITVWG